MSSTEQATSSTFTIQSIINALADYTDVTGIDLSKNSFAAAIEQLTSLDAVLKLLQEREETFKEYRVGNRRLTACLRPAVNVIQAFSGIVGEATLVPFPPANALFAGIDTLIAAASGVTASYDALLEPFECLGNFLKRLEIYATIPPSPILTEAIVKILVELLSVLALATKQIKQGRFKKFTKKLLEESEIEAVLQRLDRLTQDEARITAAQTLGVVHSLVGNVKTVWKWQGVIGQYSTGFGHSSPNVKRSKQGETFVDLPLRFVAEIDAILSVNDCNGRFNTGSLPLTRRRIKTSFGKHDIKERQRGSSRAAY